MITLHVLKDAETVGKRAADLLIQRWHEAFDADGRFVVGLATGSTPVPCYHNLVHGYLRGDLRADAVRACRTFNLDEYLPPAERSQWRFHEQSYRVFMYQHLFAHLPFEQDRIHLLDAGAADPEAECVRYEDAIKQAQGIDVQLLGIGANGHLGFCEPGSPGADPQARTQIVQLDQQTVKDNARKFFNNRLDLVPRQALSMGMGSILAARETLLLATGPEKATAVAASILGSITRFCPASLLQTHSHCTYLVDQAAGAHLLDALADERSDYGGLARPDTYQLTAESGEQHVVEVDDSVCEADVEEPTYHPR